jgi:hypothetical protein
MHQLSRVREICWKHASHASKDTAIPSLQPASERKAAVVEHTQLQPRIQHNGLGYFLNYILYLPVLAAYSSSYIQGPEQLAVASVAFTLVYNDFIHGYDSMHGHEMIDPDSYH